MWNYDAIMKLILSRKGFDSGAGGCASPILPDGRIVSLPIPSEDAPTQYGDLYFDQLDFGQLVEDLTGRRIKGTDRTHLDPDLRLEALQRHAHWRPAFGQNNAAQSHLINESVGAGDLFLYFGWFKKVVQDSTGKWQFVPSAPERHLIFGWLQVGEVLKIDNKPGPILAIHPWLAQHPHAHGSELHLPHNSIYVASERLTIPHCPELSQLPGGGVFTHLHQSRLLTNATDRRRSFWRLPEWFYSGIDKPIFSYHRNPNRWKRLDHNHWELRSVVRGQEFVMSLEGTREEASWLSRIFLGK